MMRISAGLLVDVDVDVRNAGRGAAVCRRYPQLCSAKSGLRWVTRHGACS